MQALLGALLFCQVNNFVQRLVRQFFSIVWAEGKSEPIARSVILTPKENGGLGLGDIFFQAKSIYFFSIFVSPCMEDFKGCTYLSISLLSGVGI